MPSTPMSVVCPGCRTVLDVPAGVAGVIAECASCGSEIEIPGPDGGFLEPGQGAMVDRTDWDFADLAEPAGGESATESRGDFLGSTGGRDDLAVPLPIKAAGTFDDLSLDLAQLNSAREAEELRKKAEAAREAEELRKKAEAAREAEELRKKAEAAREAEELRKKAEAAREAEELRKKAEAAREAEELRKKAEAAREAEELRKKAEAAREAEELRKKAEAAREAEELRKKAEAAREAEELRKKAEAAREAEELRKKVEAAREAEELRKKVEAPQAMGMLQDKQASASGRRKDKRQRQRERQSAPLRKADPVLPAKEELEPIAEASPSPEGKSTGVGRLVMVAAVAAVAAGAGWLAREVMARKESADVTLQAVDEEAWQPREAGLENNGVPERSRSGSLGAVDVSVREQPQELPQEPMPEERSADSPAVRNEAVPDGEPLPADPVAEPAPPAPAAAEAEIAASQPEDLKSRIAVMVPGEGKLAAPAMAVVDFLAASSWRDRLALSMAPDRVRGFMEALYRTAVDGPILPERVEFLKTVPLEHRPGRNYHVYTAFFEGMAGPVPLTVEETEVGLRVESRTFLESRERLLEKFAGNPEAPPQEFRVMLNRAHYFGDDVPGQEGKLCYKMLPPSSDPVFHAWIDRESEVYRKHFADPERQAWDVALLLVVELKWVSDSEGKRWIEVSDVIAGNWHPDSLPAPPGPVQPGR